MGAKTVTVGVLAIIIGAAVFFAGCASASGQTLLEEKAKEFCSQENTAGVYIKEGCVGVVSSLLGGGTSFYKIKEDGSLSEPIRCLVVGPDSMAEECRELLFDETTEKKTVCGEAGE